MSDFYGDDDDAWGSDVELQVMLRIKLSVAAWAYEMESCSFMTDAEFDEMSKLVDLSIITGNRKLDNFFKKHFDPDTGSWVQDHPEKRKLKWLFDNHYKARCH